jgi:hypothetical protein
MEAKAQEIQNYSVYFQLQMGFLLGGSITTTIQHIHTQVTYTIHISNKITPLKTNKQNKTENKSAHKATQAVKNILQPMNTAQKKEKK